MQSDNNDTHFESWVPIWVVASSGVSALQGLPTSTVCTAYTCGISPFCKSYKYNKYVSLI